jgi:hypothetical protein
MAIKVTKTLNLTQAKVAEILTAAYAKKHGIDPSGGQRSVFQQQLATISLTEVHDCQHLLELRYNYN